MKRSLFLASLGSTAALVACGGGGGGGSSVVPSAQSTLAPTSQTPSFHQLGVNLTYEIYENANLSLVTAADVTFARMPVAWNDIETTEGVYDWSYYDSVIPPLQAAGVKFLLISAVTNPLYFSDAPTTSDQLSICAAFHQTMAARYPGCWWEIGNEPDEAYFWPPAPDVSAYAAYLAALAPAVSPNAAEVISAGLSGIDITFYEGFLSDLPPAVTMVGLHPYGQTAESLPPNIAQLRKLTNLPFIATEYGVDSSETSDTQQAQDLTSLAVACGELQIPFVWYCLTDGTPQPDGSTGDFGLYTASLAAKPSLTAAQAFAASGG